MLTTNEIESVSDSFTHLEEFVDRVTETNQFQSLVDKRYDERDAHQRIIAFYGQAGIGKTMLLDRLEFECLRMKVPYSRINFEVGTYNDAIEILRELVRELDPNGFQEWCAKEREWFSAGMNAADLKMNINLEGGGGGVNFQDASLNVAGTLVGGDMVAGSKVEIKNNVINVSARAAHDRRGAQTALTETFITELGKFVQDRPAAILFEGLDHEFCSQEIRVWVNALLDRVRVLKGFGVLPVVTYFNPPNYEARLRSVTLRAELKPLTTEHIAEYFRARRMPERKVLAAASACLDETHGIPARVYEYVENNLAEFVEEIQEAPVAAVVVETQIVIEPLVDIKEPVVEVLVVESTQVVTAAELPVVEAVIEEAANAQDVPVVAEPPVEEAEPQKAELIETIAEPAEEPIQQVEMVAVQEAVIDAPVEPATQMEEPSVAESPEAPMQQPVEEEKSELKAEQALTEIPQSPAFAEPVLEVTSAAPSAPATSSEEVKPLEEPDQPRPERSKRTRPESKSSTANMVESILERQSDEVADIARRCAVLRWFNAGLVSAIADQELQPEQVTEILNTISDWRFVQNFGRGTYAYRREIQQYLRADLQSENAGLYTEVHRKALAYFEQQLASININDEMIWVNLQSEQITALREYLYYLLHVDVDRGFALLGKLFQSAQRLFMNGEAAILLKFADELDRSTLNANYINLLSYYEAALQFAENETAAADTNLRGLLGKSLGDELSAQVQGQLGVISSAGAKFDEAIKFFEQAQKIWQNLKRERERAKLSNNLGNVYMRKNDLTRAERSFTDALNGLNKAGTPSERALTLNNLGNVYMQKENLSRALEHYQKSLDIKKSIGDQFGVANTLSNLGTVYQRMAQDASGKKQAEYRQQAADFYTRSLETYRNFGARSNQGKLLFKLAYFHYQIGDKARAKEFLPDALEIFRDLEMPDLENASKLEKQLG